MKKYYLSIVLALISVASSAQARLETKKFKISDICERTLEVVLTGNEMLDAVFREEMPNVWNISPYEFCTLDQFEARKKSKEYYFLMITDSVFGKQDEAGIKSLTVFKGDPSAGEGTEGLYRITTIPFCSAEGGDGRENAFLPALVDILQSQIMEILDKEFNLGDMVKVKASNSLAVWPKPVLIADNDIAIPVDERMRERMVIADEDTVDEAMRNRDSQYLVAYSVASSSVSRHSVCFTMIIDAQTHELYYLRRRKASVTDRSGFVKADIDAISAHRKR